ncbi:MAG: hypothetical protein V6Z86_10060 [Hyphomicrobiales bacterium]
MPIKTMPNGDRVSFPDDMPEEQVQGWILKKFPDARPSFLDAAEAFTDNVADGLTFGAADNIAAGLAAPIGASADYFRGKGFDLSRAYNRFLDSEHERRARLDKAHPALGVTGRLVGAAMLGGGAARAGLTAARLVPETLNGFKGFAAQTAATAGDGAAFGALDAAGHGRNASEGATWGAALGAAAHPLIGTGRSLGRAARNVFRSPQRRAAQQRAARDVYNAVVKTGADRAAGRMKALGPDAVLADVLGVRGRALMRRSANIDEDAREKLFEALYGRRGGQNQRVVADIETAAGLPVGSRKSVRDLQNDAYARVAKPIDDAYEEARKAGFDLPYTPFEPIIADSPTGAKAYRQAEGALRDRVATEGITGASALARFDQTKRGLDDIASTADRVGKSDKAGRARDLSRTLRERIDRTIAGPQYAKARKLRADAFAREDAFDEGARLASGRIPIDLPGKIAARTANRDAVAQGYAAEQAENLLNRPDTAGAVKKLQTPLQQEGYRAALGANANRLTDALARERAFNITLKELAGNSTTARQLADMGSSNIASNVLSGVDIAHGGAWSAVRRGFPALQQLLATRRAKATAPYVADWLIGRTPPTPTDFVSLPRGALSQPTPPVGRSALQTLLIGRITGTNPWERTP